MIAADELWRFVADKRYVRWVWVALDAGTRQVVAMVVGDRSERTARQLWAALPHEYRDRATIHTDFLAQYRAVVPAAHHVAAGKEAGLTNRVERFGCTLRQRRARFVRKTLSFSGCPLNHVGALWYFVRIVQCIPTVGPLPAPGAQHLQGL